MAKGTFTCHDSNGQILLVITGDEEQAKVNSDGYVVGEGDPETQYVSGGNLTTRPDNPASISGNVLSNVKAGSNIEVQTGYDINFWANVDAGEHTIELPVNDMYIKVTITNCFPHKDFVYERT